MMDLRPVGVAYTEAPVSQVQKRLFPWQMLGMALSSPTGLMLFCGQPMRSFTFKECPRECSQRGISRGANENSPAAA